MRRNQRKGLGLVTTGAIALAAVVVLSYLGYTKAIPFRSHWEVSAVFKSANNIKPNSLVRIAGVNVGKVTKVEHRGDGSSEAVVTMRIDEKGRPLHDDATFKIRPRIFLEGNFFVDVSPGTPSAPTLDDGDVIPVNQTATPVQLDQILTTLQSDTREDVKLLLKEYAAGLEDEGAKGFNRSIPYWEPAYRDSAIVAEATLGLAEHDLSKYVEHAGATAEALDRNAPQLKALITDFHITARAFAAESGNLQQAIAELPRTLRAGLPALAALNASFPELRALARELRPGVRSSGPAIEASIPLVAQLRRLLSDAELRGLTRDLRPLIPSLAQLSERSVPLYREVRRNSSCVNEVILPWSKDKVPDPNFPATGMVYEEAPKPLPGLAGESRSGDGNGQWFRVLVAGGTNLLTLRPGVFAVNALPVNGTNPPKPQGRPPLRGDVPCETQQPPLLETKPGIPPPQTRIDTSTPAYKKSVAGQQKRLTKLLKSSLRRNGLLGKLDVLDRNATPAEIREAIRLAKSQEARERAEILRRIGAKK